MDVTCRRPRQEVGDHACGHARRCAKEGHLSRLHVIFAEKEGSWSLASACNLGCCHWKTPFSLGHVGAQSGLHVHERGMTRGLLGLGVRLHDEGAMQACTTTDQARAWWKLCWARPKAFEGPSKSWNGPIMGLKTRGTGPRFGPFDLGPGPILKMAIDK